jgi:D-glycero-alpha-D-manno-heptose-7-phosphate kinase
MVITQTPVRISFFGGGTDYPVWFKEHGGAVLATTIDKYIFISCRPLPPFHEHKHRIIYSKMESVREIDQIVHPAVREVYRYMRVEQGLELHHDSDLPARAGMGSSSSFTVGLLHALHALRGEMMDKETLARESIHVEQSLIGENVGCQDQIMAATGGFNLVEFHPSGGINVNPMLISEARTEELHSHLMLFYTGLQRVASDVAADQIKNTPDRKTELGEMMQMVREGAKILNSKSDIKDFGRLLDTAWQTKKKLSARISSAQIDEIYSAGLSSGAVGGKLLGAGSGGFILFFVPPERQASVRDRLKGLLHVPFAFESGGSTVIFYRRAAAQLIA